MNERVKKLSKEIRKPPEEQAEILERAAGIEPAQSAWEADDNSAPESLQH